MPKVSIREFLKKQKRIRLFSVLAFVVLLVVLTQILTTVGQKLTKAASTTCSSKTYVGLNIDGTSSAFIRAYDTGSLQYLDASGDGTNRCVYRSTAGTDRTEGNLTYKYLVDFSNLQISIYGNGTLTMSGRLKAKYLNIYNSATVTHAALDSGDLDAVTKNYKYTADNEENGLSGQLAIQNVKRVALNIVGKITIHSGGKIDVSGKGYPGGVTTNVGKDSGLLSEMNGGGPGGGPGAYIRAGSKTYAYAPGGNGYGVGGNGYTTTAGNPGTVVVARTPYDPSSLDLVYRYGSGGAAAYAWHNAVGAFDQSNYAAANGGSGGGRIEITSFSLAVSSPLSSISADGYAGTQNTNGDDSRAYSGAGGGGYIDIKSNRIYAPQKVSVNMARGGTITLNCNTVCNSVGFDGRIDTGVTDRSFLYMVWANADQTTATNGGGGGGGYVSVRNMAGSGDPERATHNCRVEYGDGVDFIPANCDTRSSLYDSSYNSSVVFEASSIGTDRYWQPGHLPASEVGQSCSSGDFCESKMVIFADKEAVFQQTIGGNTEGAQCSDASDPNCDTKRYLKDLGLNSFVTLAHQGVTISEVTTQANQTITISNTLADETVGSGRMKKIDLNIRENAYVYSTSKINVSGMGYPGGGFVWSCPTGVMHTNRPTNPMRGYGPGGGAPVYIHQNGNPRATGAGGGYGGVGGWSGSTDNISANFVAGGSSYPVTVNDRNLFDFGSGGGAAEEGTGNDNHVCSGGGSGGGRIRLSIGGNFSYGSSSPVFVMANGTNPYDTNGGYEGAYGGAGAGGYIYIDAYEYKFTQSDSLPVATGGAGGGATGVVLQTNIKGSVFNITASGGVIDDSNFSSQTLNSIVYSTGGGGGGKIFISGKSLFVSMNKEIKYITGARSTVPDAIDPYYLLSGDEIEVKITPYNLENDITLVDYAPRNASSKYCEIDLNSIESTKSVDYDWSGTGTSAPYVKWYINVANWTSGDTFSYSCTMK